VIEEIAMDPGSCLYLAGAGNVHRERETQHTNPVPDEQKEFQLYLSTINTDDVIPRWTLL
jgi:hypothetical protein